MAERDVCAELTGEGFCSKKVVFELDDKLGSHWQFLPIAREHLYAPTKVSESWLFVSALYSILYTNRSSVNKRYKSGRFEHPRRCPPHRRPSLRTARTDRIWPRNKQKVNG
eukprot:5218860-Pleurochrysis_carterae.AAC.6